jgi:hypothetical protein
MAGVSTQKVLGGFYPFFSYLKSHKVLHYLTYNDNLYTILSIVKTTVK